MKFAVSDNERKELNRMLRQCYLILKANNLSDVSDDIMKMLSKLNKVYACINQLEIQFD